MSRSLARERFFQQQGSRKRPNAVKTAALAFAFASGDPDPIKAPPGRRFYVAHGIRALDTLQLLEMKGRASAIGAASTVEAIDREFKRRIGL